MKPKFEENQKAIWILPLLVISIALMFYGYFNASIEGMNLIGFVLVVGTMVLVGLFFYQLKTTVDNEKITLSFGIGSVKKVVYLKDIESVEAVRNKWYYGWGIRYFGRGWLWNIWGLDAVELNIKGKRNVFRIGTQQPEKLKENILLKIPNS